MKEREQVESPMLRQSLLLALALTIAPALPAAAVTISGLSVTNGSTTFFDNAGPNRSVAQSATSVLSSSASGFDVRYAAVVGADVSGPSGVTFTQNMNGSFTISFQVTENPGGSWSITLDLTRTGALTLLNDGSGNANVTLGALSGGAAGAGSLSGSLGLAAVGTLSNAGAPATSPDSPFSQTTTATLSGTGTGAAQNVTLSFSFNGSATTVDPPGGAVKGDEAALRMGLDSALGGSGALAYSADNYPGVGVRTLANDGIFVTATAVPEPAVSALLALGAIALAGRRRRG